MITLDYRDLAALVGIALISIGAYLISEPLLFVVLGCVVLVLAFIYDPAGRVKNGLDNGVSQKMDGTSGSSATGVQDAEGERQ